MKRFYCLTPLILSVSSLHAATILTVAGSGGMIDATPTTYTIGAGTTADEGGGISFSDANPITISFSGPVNLVISPNNSFTSYVFDTTGNFTTVGGVFDYTVGSANPEVMDTAYTTFSGDNTNTFSWTAVDGANADKTQSNHDWGTIIANGVTSLSFTNTSFKDTYTITATAVIPEPSRVTLMGVGLLALILRRRKMHPTKK